MEKKVYALKDVKTGRIVSCHDSRIMADFYFDKILERRPWASDFIRIVELDKV